MRLLGAVDYHASFLRGQQTIGSSRPQLDINGMHLDSYSWHPDAPYWCDIFLNSPVIKKDRWACLACLQCSSSAMNDVTMMCTGQGMTVSNAFRLLIAGCTVQTLSPAQRAAT